VGGLFGAAVLLAFNAGLVRLLYRYGKLDALEGHPDVLIERGRLRRQHLERQLITVSELEAAARKQGIESLAHVRECRLETGGALTFVEHRPTDEELRHHELVGMLAKLEASQRTLAERLAAIDKRPV
jgi:uncharacterized membrane protein YcaP (DUF421 family)